MRFLAATIFCLSVSPFATGETLVFAEDFESVTPPAVPSGWTARAAAFSNAPLPSVDLQTLASGGNPSQALQLTVDASDLDESSSWFASIDFNFDGPFPTDDFSKLQLTLDVAASEADHQLVVSLQSRDSSEGTFTGKASDVFSTQTDFASIGGLLSDFDSGPNTLDPDASFYRLSLRIDNAFGSDSGNTLKIDNVRLSVVPEPASMTSLVLCSMLLNRRRRR